MALHGPHQTAVKSSSTGTSLDRTVDGNWASVMLRTCALAMTLSVWLQNGV